MFVVCLFLSVCCLSFVSVVCPLCMLSVYCMPVSCLAVHYLSTVWPYVRPSVCLFLFAVCLCLSAVCLLCLLIVFCDCCLSIVCLSLVWLFIFCPSIVCPSVSVRPSICPSVCFLQSSLKADELPRN